MKTNKTKKSANTIEREIDKIRVNLYKERKNLTIEERVKKTNERGRELAQQYGFKIVAD